MIQSHQKLHFAVYVREDCHLCQEMILALRNLQAQASFDIEVIDIDKNPELVARYNDKIPNCSELIQRQLSSILFSISELIASNGLIYVFLFELEFSSRRDHVNRALLLKRVFLRLMYFKDKALQKETHLT